MTGDEAHTDGMGDVRLRIGDARDLRAFIELIEEAGAWLRARGIPQWAAGEHVAAQDELQRRVADGALVLLEDDGDLVGGCIVTRCEPPQIWQPRPGRAAYLAKLVVRREHAGRGLSDALVDAAARWAVRHSSLLRLDCWDGNAPLRALYRRLGFEELNATEEGEHLVRLFEMQLDPAAAAR